MDAVQLTASVPAWQQFQQQPSLRVHVVSTRGSLDGECMRVCWYVLYTVPAQLFSLFVSCLLFVGFLGHHLLADFIRDPSEDVISFISLTSLSKDISKQWVPFGEIICYIGCI